MKTLPPSSISFPLIAKLIVIGRLFAPGLPAKAQGSLADYERSDNLQRTRAQTVFRDRVDDRWLPGNTRFWYPITTGRGTRDYVLVDAEKGERRAAFDHEQLAQTLRAAGMPEAQPDKLFLAGLAWNPDGTFSFRMARKKWRIALANYQVLEQTAIEIASPAALAPEDAPTASYRTGDRTLLHVTNGTATEVELFWLDLEGNRRSFGRLGAGGARDLQTYDGHVWLITDATTREPWVAFEAPETRAEVTITGRVRSSKPKETGSVNSWISRDESPDGRWKATIKNRNVVIRNVASGEEWVLSSDGKPDDAYTNQFAWSPDSQKLVGIRVAAGEEHKVAFVESSPAERVEPVLHTFNYYKPGDKLPHPRPVLWDIPARRRTPIDDALFPNPFTQKTGELDVRWAPDSSRFAFYYIQRGHQVVRILAIDAATGAASAIVDERSETFINTHNNKKTYHHWLDDSNELIWMSERDGWNHLYLYDARTGRVKNQITRGEWVVRSVDYVDAKKRQIWFQAGGIVPGQDPYYVHYCRVNFDGSSLVVMTEGDGTHACTFSPDRRFVVDRYSRVDLPAVTNLRRSEDGKLVCELERGDATALVRTGWRAPERFVAKGRDGETDIYGVIYRPTSFDPDKKYPVIEWIYANPQEAYVDKAFFINGTNMELTELGFVTVQIDGMGTSQRSKKFHDVCWKNIGDAGFPDRILWIRAAAAKYPHMDLSRVGIYGNSAGGQNSLGALLTHGDFYKVAVSSSGCHDNRMDKLSWNEQWMGWPVGPHYAAQSNVTLAPRLQGKLLLMVGEMDRNVDPASTMQVANALIKANKDFDLLVMPGGGHGTMHTPYGARRLKDFFVRHLLGREPRWTEAATN
jgi:dipeptidyl-peptidase 4